jgi:3-methyladenine DNA glycosylase AlkC
MLELKRRMELQLSPSPKSFNILVKSLKKSSTDNVGLSGFLVWPLTQFVADHGINNFETSMAALKEMTKVFTAEFAVRPFFIKDEDYMLKLFYKWSSDKNDHVRRLVSEGSRPLLPWGQKLPRFSKTPNLTWPLLENLKNDPSLYVQKSVANHINDLSKQNEDWVLKKIKHWENPWIIKQGLRTLIKNANPKALKLIGVDPNQVEVLKFSLKSSKISLGENLVSSIEIQNKTNKKVKVVVDVEVELLRSNKKHNKKVFKGKKFDLLPQQKSKYEIKTPLKAVTTRRYYPGIQYLNVIVNGEKQKKKKFFLSVP